MPRWTPESREKQRQLALQRKPWASSTGAKTAYGIQVSSQNAKKIKTPEELELMALKAHSDKLLKQMRTLRKEMMEKTEFQITR